MNTEEVEIFNVDNPDHLLYVNMKIDQDLEYQFVK